MMPPFGGKNNMLGYLSLDIICSSKLTVFLELRSQKTVRFAEQITSTDKNPSIFSFQMEAIVYITIGVWQVICSRPNLYMGGSGNTLYFLVRYKSLLSAQEFLFIGDRPRKLKTFEAAAGLPLIAQKPRTN